MASRDVAPADGLLACGHRPA